MTEYIYHLAMPLSILLAAIAITAGLARLVAALNWRSEVALANLSFDAEQTGWSQSQIVGLFPARVSAVKPVLMAKLKPARKAG